MGNPLMIRTTKPVSDLCGVSAKNAFPVKVVDKDGDEYIVTRITWIGRTCYTVTDQDKRYRAIRVRKIEDKNGL